MTETRLTAEDRARLRNAPDTLPWWHWPANRHKTYAPWWSIGRRLVVAPIYLVLTGLLILVVLVGWGVNDARRIKREML